MDVSYRALEICAEPAASSIGWPEAARAHSPDSRFADVSRQAAQRLRRGGGGRSHRASRSSRGCGVRARAVRVRAAGNGRADDAERRIQREVADAAGRTVPAPAITASSGRAREFQDWANDVAARFGYAVRFCRSADEDGAGRPSDADGGVRQPMTADHDSRALAGRADRPVGCGKSTFARKHFKPTEVLSSDYFRGAGLRRREQSGRQPTMRSRCCTSSPRKRLARGPPDGRRRDQRAAEARKPLVELAREYHVLPVAIVLDLPERVCHERNRRGPTATSVRTSFGNQQRQLRRSLRGLGREGFRHVHVLHSRRRRSTRRRSSASRCGTIASARPRPVRHHRRRPRLLRRARAAARSSSATSASDARRRVRATHPDGPKGDLRRRPRRPRAAHRRHAHGS